MYKDDWTMMGKIANYNLFLTIKFLSAGLDLALAATSIIMAWMIGPLRKSKVVFCYG